ncbi:NADH:flavin oxidoreductase [Phenylobacterium sp. J426]|uniref:NADH:flavin oxidoreductase n=1 Tax=Phenylobacterium sp. J426 TaxID=2898439 RepID=UPI0021518A3F|nr:NADH:flavin oxidoreductase [Phenylobacterium sp. J426]MCR5874510.1 NADH:flavin oxidoreductase [Phenylobacterium sp. J426]
MAEKSLFDPLPLKHGKPLKNRFMLAPLTNQQSHPDGTLSDDEFRWLTLRAEGGFGLTMTCAAHVQAQGQGFPGQLGVFGDQHLEGLTRLASAINATGSRSSVQLHHAGNRSPADLVGQPVSASDDPDTGARGLTTGEVEQLVQDFIAAAVRAEKAGFDGVELHGAHGYILAQFLSPEINRRDDRYGGSLENRARILFELIDGVRQATGPNFQLGLRLSPERFGLKLSEIVEVAQQILRDGKIDYLDMSLWDVFKEPAEEEHKGRSLMSFFTDLDRGDVKLGVAGKITTAAIAREMLDKGADYVLIGRAAILHHNFPELARDPAFAQVPVPVSPEYLAKEGVSPSFVEYLRNTFRMVA